MRPARASTRLGAALAWLLVALVWGCADSSDGSNTASPRCTDGGCGTCDTTMDCPSGATCIEGICRIAPPPLSPERDCGVSGCPSDAGVMCSRNGDCPSGEACDPQLRLCVPVEGRPCDGVDDCLLGEACLGGICQPETPGRPLDAGAEDAAPPDASPQDIGPPDAGDLDAHLVDLGAPDAQVADADVPDADLPDADVPDAEVQDALIPDASGTGPDRGLPDAATPDVSVPDAEAPDAEVPDAEVPDAEVPDVLAPDMAAPDAALPDAEAPDLDIPDAAIPDAAIPDAAIPDAAIPDAAIPDMATPDMSIPDMAIPDVEVPDEGIPDVGLPDAFVELPTPPPGAYVYERLPVGGLDELHRIAFHPSGRYAIALERDDRLFVVDWASGQATPVALGGGLRLRDVAFPFTGEGAIIVASVEGDAIAGVVLWFDDLLWQAGAPAVSEVGRVAGTTFEGVEIPPPGDPTWPHPVILGQAGAGGDFASLRAFDPHGGPDGLGAFVGAPLQQFAGIGCDDLAFAPDEFGGTGVFVACGDGGAETLFYAVIGGVGEWRNNPGNNNLGNTARVARWPGGDYALVVSWSGRAVYRFEGGQLNEYGDAPRFSRQGIYGVAFQPDGRRALIVGRTSVNPTRGTVIEFRHDLYRCDGLQCDMIDVSVPSFDQAPYNADTNTYLYDAAFRPGCDAGFVVGGYSNWQGSTGYLIRFTIEGGEACE